MTVPAPFDISVYQGDSFDLLLRIKVRDTSGTLIYQDLTGATAKAQIRATASSSTVLAEFSCSLTNQSTLPGGVLIRLTNAQTTAINADVGVYDAEVTYANGDRHTFISGKVTFIKEVTRA